MAKTRAHPPGRGLPPLVPGRRRQGRAGRQRAGARHDGHPPVRLRDLGADAGRDGRAASRRPARENAYFPLFIPRVLPQPRGRARRGLQPRARRRHPRRRQGARGAGRRAAHQRDGHRRVHGQVDRRATATCRCCSTSGPTSCAGSCGRGSSCAPASSSGRRATPRTPPRRTPAPTRRGSSTRSTRLHGRRARDARACSAARPRGSASPARSTPLRCEAMMGDGKALQMGTSHELGQNFAKAFDIALPRPSRAGRRRAGRRRGARRPAWSAA